MSTPPNGGSFTGAPLRYNIQPVPPDKHVIADTQNMASKPRVYVLSYRKLGAESTPNNWALELGYINVAGKSVLDTHDLDHEVLVWSCPMYAAHKRVREETAKQVLAVFAEDALEIEHPYELVYKFGGLVHTTP